MQININQPTTTVKFSELNIGDVFRYDIDDVDHCFMKTNPDNAWLCNCVDLTENNLGWMDLCDDVYKVQSAELNIIN